MGRRGVCVEVHRLCVIWNPKQPWVSPGPAIEPTPSGEDAYHGGLGWQFLPAWTWGFTMVFPCENAYVVIQWSGDTLSSPIPAEGAKQRSMCCEPGGSSGLPVTGASHGSEAGGCLVGIVTLLTSTVQPSSLPESAW